jgi:TP901 family phage tail tape measure protein
MAISNADLTLAVQMVMDSDKFVANAAAVREEMKKTASEVTKAEMETRAAIQKSQTAEKDLAQSQKQAAKELARVSQESALAQQKAAEAAKNTGVAPMMKNMLGFNDAARGVAMGLLGGMGLVSAIMATKNAIYETVRSAAEFETKMAEVASIVDTNAVNMQTLSKGVIDLSSKYGKDAGGLAEGLYQAISSGVDAADAIKFLDVATRAAIGGVTDAKTTVTALASALNAYGISADKAESVSDKLFVAIKVGMVRMEEMGPVIGQVAAMAHTAGMSLDELTSAIGTLTLTGMPAAEAGTAIRGMLNAIMTPSDQARKLAASLGIEFNTAALRARGFGDYLTYLANKTSGSTEALTILFPEVRGLNGMLQLSGELMGKYKDTLNETKNAAGQTQQAVEKMQDTLGFQWGQAITNVKNFGISIGTGIGGPIKETLKWYNELSAKMNSIKPTSDVNKKFASLTSIPVDKRSAEDWKTLSGIYQKQIDDIIASNKKLSEARASAHNAKILNDLSVELEKVKNLKIESDNYASSLSRQTTAQLDLDKVLKVQGLTYTELRSNIAEANKEIKSLGNDPAAAERVKKLNEVIKASNDEIARQQESKKKAAEDVLNNQKDAAEKNQQIIEQLLQRKERMESEGIKVEKEVDQDRRARAQKSAEIMKSYDDQVAQNAIEQLEAVVSDETKSYEQRKNAFDKLIKAKTKLINSDREFSIKAEKDKLEAERSRIGFVIKETAQQISEVEALYAEEASKIDKSSLPDKEVRKQALEDDVRDLREHLKNKIKDNQEALKEIEEASKKSQQKINAEAGGKIVKEIEVGAKASLDLDTGTIQRAGDEMSKIVSLSLKAATSKTSQEIEGLVSSIGSLVSEAGTQAKNTWVAAIGKIVEVAGSILQVLDQDLDIWGNQEKAQRLTEANEFRVFITNIKDGMGVLKQTTDDWLKSIGAADIKSYSYNELSGQKDELTQKQIDEFGARTGIDMSNITREGFGTIQNLPMNALGDYIQKQGWVDYLNTQPDSEMKRKKLAEFKPLADVAFATLTAGMTDTQKQQVRAFADAYRKLPNANQQNLSQVVSSLESAFSTPSAYSSRLSEVTTELAIRDNNASAVEVRDPDAATSWSSAMQALDANRTIALSKATSEDEKIAIETAYYKKRYELAKKFWQEIPDPENTLSVYRAEAENPPISRSSSTSTSSEGAVEYMAEGGIAMSRTRAILAEGGEPEVVSPLSKLPQILEDYNMAGGGVGDMEIHVLVDPNIPLTDDSGRKMGTTVGNAVVSYIRSKGR